MGAGASRKAAVASLKDKKITVAMLTFDEIDTDKNGKLSCEEISEALAKHFKEGISKDSIASVVAAFDTDGDDQLDRQEFDAVLHELNQKAAGSQADLEDAAAEKAAAEKKEAAADVKLEILLAQAMEQGLVDAAACEGMRKHVRSGHFTTEHYKQMWSSRLLSADNWSAHLLATSSNGLHGRIRWQGDENERERVGMKAADAEKVWKRKTARKAAEEKVAEVRRRRPSYQHSEKEQKEKEVELIAAQLTKPSYWDEVGTRKPNASALKAALADTVLVDAAWLARLADAGGVLPRCQDLPPGARVTLEEMEEWKHEYAVGVLVISYPWWALPHSALRNRYVRLYRPRCICTWLTPCRPGAQARC